MVEVIALYHDIGLEGGREEHQLLSGKRLREDSALKRWFSPEEIELSSLYGKIVADADREYQPERLVRRSLRYGRSQYPSLTTEQQYQRTWEHCKNKYGPDGYARFYLKDARTDQDLARLHALLQNREAFFQLCQREDVEDIP